MRSPRRLFSDSLAALASQPFVLSDQLTYISPLVMSTFVEFCKISNDLGRVERCLVHLDVKVMDFDSVLKLLR